MRHSMSHFTTQLKNKYMNELLEKLSTYNLFNYLLPGTLFVVFSSRIISYSFLGDNLIVIAFVYYFLGLSISRVGSLIVEPIFKKLGIVKFVDYGDFVTASKLDESVSIFSEATNMYRTFCAMFLLIILLKIYSFYNNPWLERHGEALLLLSFFAMFVYSYRKQVQYVGKRVKSVLGSQKS